MKKTLFIFLSLLIIGIGAHNALASFIIDYGNGLKFNFENTVTVSGHQYYIDIIEYNSATGGNGQYFLKAAVATYGTKDVMSHYEDDIDSGSTGAIETRIKNVTTGVYEPGELTVQSSTGPDSDLKTGASNEIAILSVQSNAINPGNYIIDTFVGGRVVTSAQACLPSYRSTSGNTIGTVTCGNAQSQNPGTTTTPSSIDPVLNQALSAPAGSADVIMTESTINNTTASFKFSVKPKQAGVASLVMAYATSAADISFDATNTTSTRTVIHFDSVPTINQTVPVNAPPTLTNLRSGTKYFFQIKDTINNKLYQQVSFTTSGTITTPNPTPNTATINGVTVTVNNTVTTAATADINGKYDAKITGKVKTNSLMRLGLSLSFGDDVNSFTGPVSIFPEQDLAANDIKTFEHTLHDLLPGTMYHFRIRESTRNLEITGTFNFMTGGAAPVAVLTPYDPNAGPGALLDYAFPTNLGEPTGNAPTVRTDVPTLVPCGKISDQLPLPDGSPNPDANCQFRHIAILVGNVIQFLLVMLIPLTVLACVYTGVQMILHRSIPADLIKYKDRLLKIGGGLVLMLLAFTIVATIMKAFLGDDASRYLLINISNL